MFQKFQAAQAKEAKEKDKKLKEKVMGPAFSPPQLLLELLRLLTGMRASVGVAPWFTVAVPFFPITKLHD